MIDAQIMPTGTLIGVNLGLIDDGLADESMVWPRGSTKHIKIAFWNIGSMPDLFLYQDGMIKNKVSLNKQESLDDQITAMMLSDPVE